MAEKPKLDLQLMGMRQLAEAKCPDDDWTGLKDRSARRKRQSRLNVRAYRKRKALMNGRGNTYSSKPLQTSSPSQTGAAADLIPAPSYSREVICGSRIFQQDEGEFRGAPSRVFFPLSQDHVISLVQYNVVRAALTNISLLSLFDAIVPPPCRNNYKNMPLFPAPATVPDSLAPTKLQREIPHAPWIDILPCAQMRDNIILAGNLVDKREFCRDLIGGLFMGQEDTEMKGVVVWSCPWHVSGWELTPKFATKWRFLLSGCQELLAATNRWRAIRKDGPLLVEI